MRVALRDRGRVLVGLPPDTAWVLADQAVSSLTNAIVPIAAGRMLGQEGLGVVAGVMAVCYGLIGLGRGLVGEPALVFGREDFRDAWPVVAALALLGSTGLVTFGLFRPGHGAAAVVGAALVPVVLAQDAARYWLFAGRQPARALASDVIWLLATVVAIGVLAGAGRETPASLLAAWGFGALAGLAAAGAALRAGWGSLRRWFARTGRLSAWQGLQAGLVQLVSQLTVLGVGLVAGVGTLGALRAGQLVIAPLGVALAAVPLAVLPRLGLRASQSPAEDLRRAVRRLTFAVGTLGVAYGGAVVAGRELWLGFLLGPRFQQLGTILLPFALAAAAQALAVPPGVGNRARGAGRAVFLTQLLGSAAGLPLVLALAARWGASGAAWGMSAGSVVLCLASWATYSLGVGIPRAGDRP